jgi:hypothetical protein
LKQLRKVLLLDSSSCLRFVELGVKIRLLRTAELENASREWSHHHRPWQEIRQTCILPENNVFGILERFKPGSNNVFLLFMCL